MKALPASLACVFLALGARGSDEFFARVEEALTFSAADASVRARISGSVELEGYRFQLPAPGVIQTDDDHLFAPRLSLFLDAQFGERVYGFVQARVDRGFDPTDADLEARLDEYALRYTPWKHGGLNVQVGKFATIVGNWATRHGGWTDPFITAPLPYEYLTGIWDTEVVPSSQVLLQWSHVLPGMRDSATAIEKTLRVPIVWGPAYSAGVAVAGDVGAFRYAVEAKLGSLSSRPDAWEHTREQRHHPTLSARIGYRPNPTWNFGLSASGGSYLREFADESLPAGYGRDDYRQLVLAQDLTFAWRHWQIWAEIYASRFEIPRVGDADTLAYYAEAKYKFTPRFSGALRWNQQLFNRILHDGQPTRWGHNVWRIDLAPTFRFTPHTQLKFQYSLQNGDSGEREHTRLMAVQFTLRF
jgi:hypothetical protein